jgi:predicted transcriptional regulator YdeE
MEKTETRLPEIKLIGITARTNNANEVNPSLAKITPTVQKYFHGGLPAKIPHRTKPETTFCVYTDYESDITGDYTYFIGEEVSSFETIPDGFETLLIPAQVYTKFTTKPGPMPHVVIEAWQKIWQMTAQDFGSPRRFCADFEVYDERASECNVRCIYRHSIDLP